MSSTRNFSAVCRSRRKCRSVRIGVPSKKSRNNMLSLYLGTDTDALRTTLAADLAKAGKGKETIRITDAHSRADLDAALQSGGMFAAPRVVVFDNVLTNAELREVLLESLARLKDSKEPIFIIESAPDAVTRKTLEKYSETVVRFDLKKAAKQETIFALANALS